MNERYLLRTMGPWFFPLMWGWGSVSCCKASTSTRTSQSVGMSWRWIEIYLIVPPPLTGRKKKRSALLRQAEGKRSCFLLPALSLLMSLLCPCSPPPPTFPPQNRAPWSLPPLTTYFKWMLLVTLGSHLTFLKQCCL